MRNLLATVLLLSGLGASADYGVSKAALVAQGVHRAEHHALGVVEKRFTSGHRVVGWQLGERWYFGKANGRGGNVGVLWVGGANRLSVGVKGLRWSRRF